MIHTSMSNHTSTLELVQVAALNEHLTQRPHSPLTAAQLGVGCLPGPAVLQRVTASGPPAFPYVHGFFTVPGEQNELSAELHTDTLDKLSDTFHLHQRWGL